MYPQWPNFSEHTSIREQRYLNKKQIGGDSGRQGLIFEERYAAFRLIELVASLLNGDLEAERVHIKIQVRSFVDDFAIIFDEQIEWYEIKSGKTYWGKVPDADLGLTDVEELERSIADNFRSQIRVDKLLRWPANYTLVVADADRREKLKAGRNEHGLGIVEVHMIPDSNSVSAIWEVEPEFEDWLRAVSPLTDSEADFEIVFDAFQAAIKKLVPGRPLNLLALGRLAAERFNGVLSIGRKGRLHPETAKILALFEPDVLFAVSGTTLHYKFNGNHGMIPAEIGTKAGRRFEAAILNMPNYDLATLIPILWRMEW
ncbi:hypothetical protein IB270_34700 [Ensifer sp. ENS05]|uniref:hypothetical protein n=1 Tax=Ensifer sp. ENS05 TaxID=2769277 RepID=UPI0017868FC1|nr:hypothetical protein [Ensifer sp. ENS05]MBD9597977.1 hypothetical protein [Ensifer sp. ENS05]